MVSDEHGWSAGFNAYHNCLTGSNHPPTPSKRVQKPRMYLHRLHANIIVLVLLFSLSSLLLLFPTSAGLSSSDHKSIQKPAILHPAPAAPAASQPQIGLAPFATGFFQPTIIASSGIVGDMRLFVAERDGAIKLLDGQGNPIGTTSFMNIDDRVFYNPDLGYSEQGILGMAFDPNYDGVTNRDFYLHYTGIVSGTLDTPESRISRFRSNPSDLNKANRDTEEILLTVEQPHVVHNGGSIAFGPDGFLYVGFGDGEGAGDNKQNAQNMGILLGKLLRLDVRSTPDGSADCSGRGGDYVVPASNPFVDGSGGDCDEIWALGLRNPWRFSFDRDGGDLFVGDVGENRYEELDFQEDGDPGGQNYGWPCYEGNHVLRTTPPNCDPPPSGLTFPRHEYPHPLPGFASAIVAGHVYRGTDFPSLEGLFFYADYGGKVWTADLTGGGFVPRLQVDTFQPWSTFGENSQGELFIANVDAGQGDGSVYRIIPLPESVFIPISVKNFD